MLRGYVDAVVSSGFVEGWVYDTERPLRPLRVAVVTQDSQEVASGIAHLYREDLALANCAGGWCAFRLRLAVALSKLLGQPLAILEQTTQTRLPEQVQVPLRDEADTELTAIADIIAADPTVISSVAQLQACEAVFREYLKAYGVDEFVRAAYVYILARPADPSGITLYGQMIRKNLISPFKLLGTLADSEEFRSRSRLLAAPNTPAFPFRT